MVEAKNSEGTQSQPTAGNMDDVAPKSDKVRVVSDDLGGSVAAKGTGVCSALKIDRVGLIFMHADGGLSEEMR